MALWSTLRDLSRTQLNETRIEIGESPDDALHLQELSVAQHSGRIVINGAVATFRAGEKVLIKGEFRVRQIDPDPRDRRPMALGTGAGADP